MENLRVINKFVPSAGWCEMGGSLPFILHGDINRARDLMNFASNYVQQMRRMNPFGLEQQFHTLLLPDGSKIEYRKDFGKEYVNIHSPSKLKEVKKLREKYVLNIFPAFEALDEDGNLIGFVICRSGTWKPPYELIPLKIFCVKPEKINPFGFENWRAGKTDSPTDPAPWSLSVRPFTEDLKDLLIYRGLDGYGDRSITDLASRGEEQVEQAPEEQHGDVGNFDIIWSDIRNSYVKFIADNDFWVNKFTPKCPEGFIDPRNTATWWTGRIRNYIIGYEGISDCTHNYDARMVNVQAPTATVADMTLYPACGTLTFPQVWTTEETLVLPAGTPYYDHYDIDLIESGEDLEYLKKWSTKTAKEKVGFLYGMEHVSSDSMYYDAAGARNYLYQTPTFDEYVVIDGERYLTVSARGPYGIGAPVNVPITTRGVYPRYYALGENAAIFLISIHRNPMNPDVYGIEPNTAPEQWQYGIYHKGAKEPWKFDVSFPVSNTDGSGTGPVGSHIIPDIKYEKKPVYCLGTYRLVREECYMED